MFGTQQEVNTKEILDLFRPVEGQIACYYGRIRNGKTYSATADIHELVARGEVVYANWNIDIDDYDERNYFWKLLYKWIFGKNIFFKYKKGSFHYFDPEKIDINFLGRLVNAHVFIDEGQWIFNSHTKDHDIEKRKLIFHNGHYCRSLNIITQRPINIFKDMRSQVHVWYKCEKKMSFPVLLFQRFTIEDMKDDLPDEEEGVTSVKTYFAKKRILSSYNTHAMRAEDAITVYPEMEVYYLRWHEILASMALILIPGWLRFDRWVFRPKARQGHAERAMLAPRPRPLQGQIKPRLSVQIPVFDGLIRKK